MGARYLNQELPAVLSSLQNICPNMKITHQTGKHESEHIKTFYKNASINADVTTFITDMPAAFRTHDLLVSRAGATVCAEIMAAGMAAILVPYPHANAHQQYNALALTDRGAAVTIAEGPHFRDQLASTIKDLYSNPQHLAELGANAKMMSAHNASSIIVNRIVNDINRVK